MSNSVVKVTDSMLNDSLLLLVGEDGTVSPDKATVQSYLSQKSGATNLQLMHINKTDGEGVDVTLDNVTYIPEADSEYVFEEMSANLLNMSEVAKILYSVKLDHDYTPHVSPTEEVDELAQTLSMLEGVVPEVVAKPPTKPAIAKPNKPVDNKLKAGNKTVELPKLKKLPTKVAPKAIKPVVQDDDDDDEQESDEDYTEEVEVGESDSDFELDDSVKTRQTRRSKAKPRTITKPKTRPLPPAKTIREPEVVKPVEPKTPETPIAAPASDKKTPKKEKKTPKPIPDDFALFSTPDIIRRVGGKEPTTPEAPVLDSSNKQPAKIEVRSRSAASSDTQNVPNKHQSRLSLDGKNLPKSDKVLKTRKLSNTECSPPKRQSVDSTCNQQKIEDGSSVEHLEIPTPEEIQAIIGVEPPGVNGNLPLVEASELSANNDQNSMALDGSGLDLDPSLLENLNNDLISDDILFQVAQSLVSNTDLQNAIDKGINEGNLMIDPSMMGQDVTHGLTSQVQGGSTSLQKGMQIVRPDGRVVVIPPIERPTTRSRNKRRDPEKTSIPKFTHKPLDEEHVSGNELDSSDDGEEESEDDPNKLWCICNQPHNNRFMICCDTCEEWYHGKCVNITKAMGQQMESEGREWICIYCRDQNMKRPSAAARRVRKASRNSRQSTDSAGSSNKQQDGGASSSSIPCVVCHKPSRNNSIFCSEACILTHASGVEKVVVFERSTGRMYSGNKAPTASNLDQWLKEHPGFEVVRSSGKIVTSKQNLTQSKLKLVKNPDNRGVSLAIQKKGVNVGVLKHSPKHPDLKSPTSRRTPPGFKVINKQSSLAQKALKIVPATSSVTTTPPRQKVVAPPTSKTVVASLSIGKEAKPIKTPKARLAEANPQPKQENIRENVQRTMCDQLMNRVKMVDDIKVTEDEVKTICAEVESQLYKCFGDTGQKYKNKYRSLMFNIKDIKNQSLWRRIVEKTIGPYQLVRLSPDDLASQELALWREREAKHQLDMIKKSELELLNCNRQYVLKTHKGEQVLEDNRGNSDAAEVITSLTEGDATKELRESSKDEKRSSKSHKDRDRKSGDNKEKHHRSISKEHDKGRKRSRSRDRGKHGDRKRSRSRGRDRHRKSSHKSSKHKKETHRGSSTDKLDKKSKEILEQLVDNKIVPPLEDRLWKESEAPPPPPVVANQESDSDHEPTSTVTIPTPPRQSDTEEYQPAPTSSSSTASSSSTTKEKPDKVVSSNNNKVDVEGVKDKGSKVVKSSAIWKGVINMIDVAQISITAHEVSGECHGLGTELPAHLDIIGRIAPETVWDYISKMKCSNSKIISCVRLKALNVEEKVPYLALYSYLSNRDRLGVVKSTNKAVKDFYIYPLAASKPVPPALLPLAGSGFEDNRPAMLLGIIVRDKRKRPSSDTTASSSSSSVPAVKKVKVEIAVNNTPTPPQRSYTPPPVKDPRLKLPLPPPPVAGEEDDDEPYSPEDSDPDGSVSLTEAPPTLTASFLDTGVSSSFQPFSSKFDDIPGLGNPTLPSSTQEIQREMEKLNKEIEAQKSEINSISQNIATASTEIGTSALANIALPSNLQQILDSIKTIGSVGNSDATPEAEDSGASSSKEKSGDLTIPLMLPTSFSRSSGGADTIPLNLPAKKKKEESGVLSSLSEEDLIRKAQEMLGETPKRVPAPKTEVKGVSFSIQAKRPKLEVLQPPVPGLDDD